MSTSSPSTTFPEQSAERALFAKIQQIDFSFRDRVKYRIEELNKQAGKAALDFLLHPENIASEQAALAANCRGGAIAEGLHRYIAACRNYHDAQGAVLTVEGVAESLEILSNAQRSEAEMSALKDLTGSANEVADGRQRKMALNSLGRSEGTMEFVELLRNAFAPILQERSAVVRND